MMKKHFKRAALAAAMLSMGMAGQASAAIIDFETETTDFVSVIDNGYAGFNWNNAAVVDEVTLLTVFPVSVNSGYDNVTSGSYSAYNDFGNDMTVTAAGGGLFDLGSVNLAAAWNLGLDLTVTGLLGGATAFQQSVSLDHDSVSTFNFNFLGIDELVFSSSGGTDGGFLAGGLGGSHFVMDNLGLSMTTIPASVPEPGTLSLLAAGLAGFAWKRRKQRAATPAAVAA